MRRRPLAVLAALALGGLVVGNLGSAPPARVDFGQWRAVVVHSDDWGLEGWFPRDVSDSLRHVLSAGVPAWQAAYLSSTLESADEVETLADLFASLRDLDGLPLVLQANTIVAGPSVRETGDGSGWPVHPSGTGPDYARVDLDTAVDAAIARGVWWPELHGLTHYDLVRYAKVRAERDPLALAAASEGVFAYEGFRRDSELGHPDAERALRVVREAVRRFRLRFGRAPRSVIAPDYRWTDEDEVAWTAAGLAVVQAKREQVDRTLAPRTPLGRVRKWLGRRWFAIHSPLFAVERTVDLEPYGSADPGAAQGAAAAHAALEAAFRRSEAAVVSIHRVQLISRDPRIADAGRAQLLDLVLRLQASGGARFLVDEEVRQLARRGWSVHERGERLILRNWTEQAVRAELPTGQVVVLRAGTSALVRNSSGELEKSLK